MSSGVTERQYTRVVSFSKLVNSENLEQAKVGPFIKQHVELLTLNILQTKIRLVTLWNELTKEQWVAVCTR